MKPHPTLYSSLPGELLTIAPFLSLVGPSKVRISREGVAVFNAYWPRSKLRPTRAYWFEFDDNGALVDTDVPEHDDGETAAALSRDCLEWLES